MFELLRTFLGYCIQCRQPSVVGECKIMGWNHVFNICNPCLVAQANKITYNGPQSPAQVESLIEKTTSVKENEH